MKNNLLALKKLGLVCCLLGSLLQLHSQGLIVPGVATNLIAGEISVANNPAYPLGSGGPFTGFSLRPQGANNFQFDPVVDTGVRVFLVSSNNPISLQPILASSYAELTVPNTYVFNNGVPFYVGLYTGSNLPQNGIYTVNPLFGWARLVNNGGVISLLDSALEYGGGGIFAGTQTIIPVPEPSVLVLSALGGLIFGWRHWQQRR